MALSKGIANKIYYKYLKTFLVILINLKVSFLGNFLKTYKIKDYWINFGFSPLLFSSNRVPPLLESTESEDFQPKA